MNILSGLFHVLSVPQVIGIILGLIAASALTEYLTKKLPATLNAKFKEYLIDFVAVIICALFVFVFFPTHDIITAIFALGIGAAWKIIYQGAQHLLAKLKAAA